MNYNKLGIGLIIGAVVVAAVVIITAVAIHGNDTRASGSVCADKRQSTPCFNTAGQWVGSDGAARPASSSPTYRYTAPSTSSYAPPPIQKDDFTVDLKVTSKQCFGSAGCNVVVEPVLNYKNTASQMSAYGACDITYSISGDESGEVVGTAYGQGGTQYRVSSSVLSTKSSKVQPKATVTDVTCR